MQEASPITTQADFVPFTEEMRKTHTILYYDLPNSSTTPAVMPLNESVNTLPGTGPFSTYADVFTRLSDIPGKQIMLGYTHACRMFIGFKSPMYLHDY